MLSQGLTVVFKCMQIDCCQYNMACTSLEMTNETIHVPQIVPFPFDCCTRQLPFYLLVKLPEKFLITITY